MVIRDPRVTFDDNKRFIDELEKYFEQPADVKLVDARPELHYQVGVTPEGVETPRCMTDPSCHTMINQVRMPPISLLLRYYLNPMEQLEEISVYFLSIMQLLMHFTVVIRLQKFSTRVSEPPYHLP